MAAVKLKQDRKLSTSKAMDGKNKEDMDNKRGEHAHTDDSTQKEFGSVCLQDEILKALERKNREIRNSSEEQRAEKRDGEGNSTGGFDEWSVSWP
jgi:hypothetical protein